jgi:acetyl esterase/lipase
LPASSADLAKRVGALKQQGYRRVVLAGQSFGGFLSLMAAEQTDGVEAVVAIAPAAFGSFFDSYDSWQMNATELYRHLDRLAGTRVMLAFFHGDDYDPGGRGPQARSILAAHNVEHLVIDQPRDLVGHLAGASGLFVRRYGACLRQFLEAPLPSTDCESAWGRTPGAEIAAPVPPPQGQPVTVPAAGTTAAAAPPPALSRTGRWYGFYANGREFLLTIDNIDRGRVQATYAVGPSVDGEVRGDRVHRVGRFEGDAVIFDEAGKPSLRLSALPAGAIQVHWISTDRSVTIEATARRTD